MYVSAKDIITRVAYPSGFNVDNSVILSYWSIQSGNRYYNQNGTNVSLRPSYIQVENEQSALEGVNFEIILGKI